MDDNSSQIEKKLDVIIGHLEKMDRRDKYRMIGGYVHSLLTIIPLLFFLWSTWYLYNHMDDIIASVARNAASQVSTMGEAKMQSWSDFFKGFTTK